jgi:aminoglycoside phosphotransferase (APT) family kinase protein
VFTRPTDVADTDIGVLLGQAWGHDVESVEYLAVGFGSHHWRAVTPSATWFVTVDDLVAKRREPGEPLHRVRERLLAALATAGALRDAGYDFVVAPVPTAAGGVACDLDERYVVAVYPHVDGRTHRHGDFADPAGRDAVVGRLAALHRAPDHCRRFAMAETFDLARRADLFDAMADLGGPWDTGPFAEPVRALLARHAGAVVSAFDTYDALTEAARARSDRFVLTHGEPHPGNTITTDCGVVLVDWDTALVAPPERDLWDVVGQDPTVSDRYEALTGRPVDHDVVELYRLAWALTEIGIYVSDLRRPHERTDDTTEAWENLQHYLDPTRY